MKHVGTKKCLKQRNAKFYRVALGAYGAGSLKPVTFLGLPKLGQYAIQG
jgi:hypothetical protein